MKVWGRRFEFCLACFTPVSKREMQTVLAIEEVVGLLAQ